MDFATEEKLGRLAQEVWRQVATEPCGGAVVQPSDALVMSMEADLLSSGGCSIEARDALRW